MHAHNFSCHFDCFQIRLAFYTIEIEPLLRICVVRSPRTIVSYRDMAYSISSSVNSLRPCILILSITMRPDETRRGLSS